MKAIAIMGSPRAGMNTDVLLDNVIKGLESAQVDVEKISLKDLHISPCIGCYACSKTGRCFMEDDMTPIYDKFNESDIIVVASPMYFNTVSSLTKIMIDRCQAFWSSKYILNKSSIDKSKKRKGMFLCTAGAPSHGKDGFLGATMVMDLFFKAVNADYEENILLENTDEDFIPDREDVLEEAFNKGKEIAVF